MKNNIIHRLREVNHSSELEKKVMRDELKNCQAEIVVSKAMFTSQIRDLEDRLLAAHNELKELKELQVPVTNRSDTLIQVKEQCLAICSSLISFSYRDMYERHPLVPILDQNLE